MAGRQKVKVNLKLIAGPLDTISAELDKVIKTKKSTIKAVALKAALGVLRKELSAICCDNRWYCDV